MFTFQIGTGNFSFIDNNAEHFAKWARNNLWESNFLWDEKEFPVKSPDYHGKLQKSKRALENVIRELEFGDLIEIKREKQTDYAHWGVYFGQNEEGTHLICHFWDDKVDFGLERDKVTVRVSPLIDVVDVSISSKNNEADKLGKVYSKEEIRKRCESKVSLIY